ncbi:MAG: Formate dehydrogenase O putative subunit [uncultured Chloroflexi bacterium]|uniref:Formate dehydrogenase O putative subunit n=1 Tax=uncultured Chloroflexota bacterium TaxID=166587 RepID=A0A6J4K3T1_9CHLR|nr:MAG: Formate dehydrogenase O putative subunit [uncultured Chloroflexota bacterium]
MTGASYERQWEARGGRRRARTTADDSRSSYYGVPPIHKPHWKWLIIIYFFLGGLSGASYAIAGVADLLGRRADRRIVRAGVYVSFAALLPCPILLILDLGRPERFLYMFRVLKLRSPMSVGTWALTLFGAFCTLSALIQAAHDGLLGRHNRAARLLAALPARAIGAAGAGPAFLVAGYTGVLLAATAVPLWTKSFMLMGPLFITSAASNATAAIALLLSLSRGTSRRTLHSLEKLDALLLAGEALLLLATWARLGRVIARPLHTGRLGLLNGAVVLGLGIAVPLVIQLTTLLAGSTAQPLATGFASVCVLTGGFAFRYVMVMAGRASADDPQATFDLTKSRLP